MQMVREERAKRLLEILGSSRLELKASTIQFYIHRLNIVDLGSSIQGLETLCTGTCAHTDMHMPVGLTRSHLQVTITSPDVERINENS